MNRGFTVYNRQMAMCTSHLVSPKQCVVEKNGKYEVYPEVPEI
jgi:hypothetical protein